MPRTKQFFLYNVLAAIAQVLLHLLTPVANDQHGWAIQQRLDGADGPVDQRATEQRVHDFGLG